MGDDLLKFIVCSTIISLCSKGENLLFSGEVEVIRLQRHTFKTIYLYNFYGRHFFSPFVKWLLGSSFLAIGSTVVGRHELQGHFLRGHIDVLLCRVQIHQIHRILWEKPSFPFFPFLFQETRRWGGPWLLLLTE